MVNGVFHSNAKKLTPLNFRKFQNGTMEQTEQMKQWNKWNKRNFQKCLGQLREVFPSFEVFIRNFASHLNFTARFPGNLTLFLTFRKRSRKVPDR